jgi:RNA polymerase II subunit A-like phosphatase
VRAKKREDRTGITQKPASKLELKRRHASEDQKECRHEICFGGVCVTCGEYASNTDGDARKVARNDLKLTVSNARAKRQAEAHVAAALSSRQLDLVLDLDHTLVHSVEGCSLSPREAAALPRDEVVFWARSKIGAQDQTGALIFLRPGLSAFLSRASKRFRLSISTMGVQEYAAVLLGVIDPSGRLFGDRVVTRPIQKPGQNLDLKKDLNWGHSHAPEVTVIMDDMFWAWEPYLESHIVFIKPFVVGAAAIQETIRRTKGLTKQPASPSFSTEVETAVAGLPLLPDLPPRPETLPASSPSALKGEGGEGDQKEGQGEEQKSPATTTPTPGKKEKDKEEKEDDWSWITPTAYEHLIEMHDKSTAVDDGDYLNTVWNQLERIHDSFMKLGSSWKAGVGLSLPSVSTCVEASRRRVFLGVVAAFVGWQAGSIVTDGAVLMFQAMGGVVATHSADAACTHVVSTMPVDVPHITVVTPLWLLQSIWQMQLQKPEEYGWHRCLAISL